MVSNMLVRLCTLITFAIKHIQRETCHSWGKLLTVFQTCKRKEKTDREQKAWGLIRTATGIVAKLISQKEIGLQSISVSSREGNLLGTPQGEQPWYWLPDIDSHDSWMDSSEIWRQMKYPVFPHGQCPRKLVSLGYSHLQFHSEAKPLQVSLEYNHMDIQHVAALSQKQHNILLSLYMWFGQFIFIIVQKQLFYLENAVTQQTSEQAKTT